MSLRKLPEIKAARLPSVCAFEMEPDAVDRWSAGIQAADSGDNTISILDVIGEDWWTGGGVTSKRIAAALRAIGDNDVVVDLNSPGGDFFEGIAIYNQLRAHPHKVTVRILSVAASAASIIAMAGDEIEIGKAGFIMVHNAWAVAVGNRHDMADAAKTMEPFDDAMATVYADRAGVDKSKAVEWMDGETWFNGDQALNAGLATAYLPADVVSEDKTKSADTKSVKAGYQIEALLGKAGMPRSERRALLADATGGMPGAALTVMPGADEMNALLKELRATLQI